MPSSVCIPPVGASLLAKDVNDNACCLNERGVWTFFASKLAPTGTEYIRKISVDCEAAIASKLAPTEEQRQSGVHHALHHSSGRALARLQLLILIHPPPRQAEWRCLSGDWRAAPFDAVELIACRSKRSRPEGNAPG
ncbi:hypothetical protein PspS34_11090 [Pseudomonas sp. S34]|nr:hypothetical protein PspS34_11090 [Pseudomonas sp. S34]